MERVGRECGRHVLVLPFDIADTRDAPHGGDDAFELLLVTHLDGHFNHGGVEAVVVGAGFNAADADLLVVEDLGQLRKYAGTVVRVDDKADVEILTRPRPSINFDAPLRSYISSGRSSS